MFTVFSVNISVRPPSSKYALICLYQPDTPTNSHHASSAQAVEPVVDEKQVNIKQMKRKTQEN